MKSKKSTTRTPLSTSATKKATAGRTPISTTKSAKTIETTKAAPSKSRVTLAAKSNGYTTQDVATRAYFLSIERGGSPEENWVQAEAEFRSGLWA